MVWLVKGELLACQSFVPWVSSPGHEQLSTQIGCPTLPLACVLLYWFILRGSFILHLGLI